MMSSVNNEQTTTKAATLKDFLDFPCEFDFKIVGKNSLEYFSEIQQILCNYLNVSVESINKNWQIRYSSTKKYATINYVIVATNETMIYELQKEIQKSIHVITCL